MIYSCTLFFNEFNLLELKLSEELEYVDQFIIVQSPLTFSGKPKDLLLEYDHPKVKVINIPIDLVNHNFGLSDLKQIAFAREGFQRSYALNDIEIQENDVIIISDIDEIIIGKEIPDLVEQCLFYGEINLKQKLFYYKLNLLVGDWFCPRMVAGYLYQVGGLDLDNWRRLYRNKVIETTGKHFSYLSDAKGIVDKIESFSHVEFDKEEYKDLNKINYNIENKKDLFNRKSDIQVIAIDESYPKSILNDWEKWKEFIC